MKLTLNKISNLWKSLNHFKNIYDLFLHHVIAEKRYKLPNPLNKFSAFCGFSQSDENGITLEILRRIGLEKVWITKENIFSFYQSTDWSPDGNSQNLGGNDFNFVEEFLQNNVRPKLFIVEYNAKFPPNFSLKIDYDPEHQWKGNDYFGALLKSFNSLFSYHNYQLVCCSLIGSNAFFVSSEYTQFFDDVPKDSRDIYCEPFYFLRSKKMHLLLIKIIEKLSSNAWHYTVFEIQQKINIPHVGMGLMRLEGESCG